MRLRPDELEAWRERAAQTVLPDDASSLRLEDTSDETEYELALRRYAGRAIFDLEHTGAPKFDDAERKIAHARSHKRPALTDSCRASVGPGGSPACDGSCKRERT